MKNNPRQETMGHHILNAEWENQNTVNLEFYIFHECHGK